MGIGNRLRLMADLIIKGAPVADIGADHGQLALYILEKNWAPAVIVTELGAKPGEKLLTRTAGSKRVSDLRIRLGDGLKVLSAQEVATVIIAGLGGDTIVGILKADIKKSRTFRRYILQPMSRLKTLRLWCAEQGWPLLEERVAVDGGREFVIMVYEPGSQKYALSALEAEMGPLLLQSSDSDTLVYKQKMLDKFRIIIDSLKNAVNNADDDKFHYYRELTRELENNVHADNS
ncbi:MAG: class I SAM-dependent methyltransferase [Syntrophomonadaceae bacterium]|jgi:tRNA (adenine22-N1)-methyltransferase|nr:class I SAM-dependent methyltransferase [Syntrophomonadaceae bacterium]